MNAKQAYSRALTLKSVGIRLDRITANVLLDTQGPKVVMFVFQVSTDRI